MKRIFFHCLIACASFTAGCNLVQSSQEQQEQKKIELDTSITTQTSFNNLFIDSNTINDFLAKHPGYQKFQPQYVDFYKQRNFEAAWFDSSGITEQAYNFMNLLDHAVGTYNDSSLYNKDLVKVVDAFKSDSSGTAATTTQDRIGAELMLTGQFFSYASRVYNGADIDVEELGWFIPRKKIDLSVLLDSIIQNKNEITSTEFPLSDSYKKLLDFLPVYYKIQDSINWDTIAYPVKALRPGSSSPLIPVIKQRLYALGDLTEEDSSRIYDSALADAARSFQTRMGLKNDGLIGKTFLKELNVAPSARIQQMLINLERLRWMPKLNDSAMIVVNIPEYKMYVYDGGQLQFDMDVVVGAAATGTVIFTGNLKYIVFSPYWNVPSSIIKNEILPAMQRDRNYLANHHMEEYGSSSDGVPSIRQLPGPDNALGRVKFLFPNNFDIYFHDTNNPNAFNATNRNLSHGCIRLSDPKELATYLLQDQPDYTSEKIDSLMNLDKEKWVTLKKTVPVMISYYTAFVDDYGKLNFRNDIYGHDSAMAVKLFAAQ